MSEMVDPESEGKKNLGGRPNSYEWTPAQRDKVREAAKYGVPHSRIAQSLGMTVPTLRKYFSEELYDDILDTMTDLSREAYTLAMDGSEQLMKFLLSTHVRMTTAAEDSEVEKNSELTDYLKRGQARVEAMKNSDVVSEQ